MKKVLFVLAFVAVYGVSMAMSNMDVVAVNDTQVTLVADVDDNNVIPEGEKEKEKAKTTEAKKAPASADAKAEGCSGEKSTAKAEGCSGDKSTAEAKSDCSSSCSGKK